MIQQITWNFLGPSNSQIPNSQFLIKEESFNQGIDFSLEVLETVEVSQIYLDIQFQEPIQFWRYLDYTWRIVGSESLLANSHSPKLVKLQSGLKVLGKNTTGCWEYLPEIQGIRWYLYHPMLSPTMVYNTKDERVFLESQIIEAGVKYDFGLVWTEGAVPEWARTPLGFVPTVVFTDHSDFDTLSNLKVQRAFFKQVGIKVTKGFFLYDYTHKEENASFEEAESRQELIEWEKEGHELAYHALSQSYRIPQSEQEFQVFESPKELTQVDTYIDHGFHPYNYTKQALGNWGEWYRHMAKKGIRRIWTYVDAGEAHMLNANQIDPLNFTWGKMKESTQLANKIGIKRKNVTALRNFLMYGVSETVLRQGKVLGGKFSYLKNKPGISSISQFLASGANFFLEVLKPKNIREQVNKSKEVFPVNRFGTLFFRSPNQSKTQLTSFQTLAVRDYDQAFSEFSIQRLLQSSGVMIAHTYFAYTGLNHEGRLFENATWKIREEAKEGFQRLGNLVSAKQLWNPTLREMHLFYEEIENLEYSFQGDSLILKKFNGVTRTID